MPRGLRPAAPLPPLPPPPPAPASAPRRRGQVPFSGVGRRQLDFRLTTTSSLSIGVLRHSGASTSLQFLLLLLLPSFPQVASLAYFQLELSLPSRYLGRGARMRGSTVITPLSPDHLASLRRYHCDTMRSIAVRDTDRRDESLVSSSRHRCVNLDDGDDVGRRGVIDDRPEVRRTVARRCATSTGNGHRKHARHCR